MLDTYRAVKALTAVGFTETQAQTLLETVGEGRGDLATKDDLDRLAQVTKDDLGKLAQVTKDDLGKLAQVTKDDLDKLAQVTKDDLDKLAQVTKDDLDKLAQVTKDDLGKLAERTKDDLDNLAERTSSLEAVVVGLRTDFQTLEARIERRLTNLVLQLAILQVMVGGLIVAALRLLP